MTIMPTWTIVFFIKALLSLTTLRIMGFSGSRSLHARLRIVVYRAEFLTTLPTPAAPTPCTDLEDALLFQATSKDIVTCGILEAPSFTPGALLGIIHSIVAV
jgi:hypothetical protein